MALTAAGSLLERERELNALAQLMGSAARGSGAGAMIEAEAGIGKTALLAAVSERASAAGMAVLTATAGELESEFVWGVVRQLFDATVARAPGAKRDRLLDGAASMSRPALGFEAAHETVDVSYGTLHGLYWLTANLAQEHALLLSIDDVQWADLPSLRFIAHLLPRVAELPILLVMAGRPRSVDSAPGTELLSRIATQHSLTALRLMALSRKACTTLVRENLTQEADEDVCVACHELSGGNPFLLRALLAELAEGHVEGVEVTAQHVRRITPAAVSASVLLRLARLPEGAVALARAVAILGSSAPFHTACRLAGLGADEAASSAATLIRAGILIEADALAFVHPLVRAAVYGDLAGPERSRWHRRAARMLDEDRAGLDHVAAQLMQSMPSGDEWTVQQLRRGAADAWGRGAPDVAADYLRRALAEPPVEKVRGPVLYELGQVQLVQDPALAAPDLRDALEFIEEPRLRADVALALGDALTLLGRLPDAIRVFGGGIAELEDDDSRGLRASLEAARLGAARWEPSAQALRHELVAEIRRRDTEGTSLDPRVHSQLAIEAAAEGIDRNGAVRHARAALGAAERPTGAATSSLPEAMLVLAFADLVGESQTAVDEWLSVARSRAWPLAVVLGATIATLVSLYRGAISDAVANAWEAVSAGAEIRLAPVTVAFLVEALVERGDLDQARDELSNRGLEAEVPYAWAPTPLLLARGRLHAAAGDHRAALEDLMEAGRRAETWGVRNPAMHPWRSSAAASLAQLGERDHAVRLAEEEIELARRWGAPRPLGVALRAAGIAHGGEHGLSLLREATAVLEPSAAPLEHARAVTDLGSALRRAGHRAEAREHLRKGLHLAHELGALHVARGAREELIIAGARPRRDALRGRDALTPSELRVAQLAAQGRTNREIAEHLFITLRTVEAHLTNSYAKLNIASRQQLAAALSSSPI
ncbi:MAG: ATP-binding protein [Solirubrobacteraceae bacterium]